MGGMLDNRIDLLGRNIDLLLQIVRLVVVVAVG